MKSKFAKITKKEIETCILPFIPKNKRGFAPKVDLADVIQCIIYKLKTGVQWEFLFVDIQRVKPQFSWQLVYYYYRKWCDCGVFYQMNKFYLEQKKGKFDLSKLNLDGTHSYVKKSAESVGYQHRKKGKTSNVLVLTDGNGIPLAAGDILSGNHNDLYNVVPQFSRMIKELKSCKIVVENSILNADKGFDANKLRRACRRRKITPNIKENLRNRKKKKRGRKRYFDEDIYKKRFVNERAFAWLDSFRTLLVRFDKLDKVWLNWHYIAWVLILLKV
jgi:transposase